MLGQWNVWGVDKTELKRQSKWKSSGNALFYGTCSVISSKLQNRDSDSVIANMFVRARTVPYALQCHHHILLDSP